MCFGNVFGVFLLVCFGVMRLGRGVCGGSIVWWCACVIVLVLRYCFCCCWRGWVLCYNAVLLGGGLELLVSNAFGLWFGLMGKMVSGAEWS